jgi:hypothetical protein
MLPYMGNCWLQNLRRNIFTGICKWQFPIWKGVKQNERNHRHYSYICGGYAVLVHPGRSAGGQADGGNETERGMGCRQDGQTAGTGRGIAGIMQRTSRQTVCTVISGKGSGKDAARRNAITFFRKEKRHHQMFRKILCHRNLAKMALVPVKAVHMADILHVLAIAYRRFCMK